MIKARCILDGCKSKVEVEREKGEIVSEKFYLVVALKIRTRDVNANELLSWLHETVDIELCTVQERLKLDKMTADLKPEDKKPPKRQPSRPRKAEKQTSAAL